MNRKEKRSIAGAVSDFISREFRAIDCPSKEDILGLHAGLKKDYGYSLLNMEDGVNCLAAKMIFILEKRKAGYSLNKIPDCLDKRKNIINEYYYIRNRPHGGRYRISQGLIAKASSVDAATGNFSAYEGEETLSPCQ